MKCAAFTAEFTAYLDQELGASRRAELEDHLSQCDECAGDLELLRRAARLVESNVPEIEPPAALWNRIQGRILPMPAPDARGPAWWDLIWSRRWLAAAASLVLLAAAGVGVRGFLARQASEDDLRRYMSEYVTTREAERRQHLEIASGAAGTPRAAETAGGTGYNPFAVRDTSSFDNPFRSEEQ